MRHESPVLAILKIYVHLDSAEVGEGFFATAMAKELLLQCLATLLAQSFSLEHASSLSCVDTVFHR